MSDPSGIGESWRTRYWFPLATLTLDVAIAKFEVLRSLARAPEFDRSHLDEGFKAFQDSKRQYELASKSQPVAIDDRSKLAALIRQVIELLRSIRQSEQSLEFFGRAPLEARFDHAESMHLVLPNYSPDSLAEAIWDIVWELPGSERPAKPTGCVTVEQAIEALRRVREWCASNVSNQFRNDKSTPTIGPRLAESETRILLLLQASGRRLTTQKILAVLEKKYGAASTGTTKSTLAGLVRRGLLTNRRDVDPPGYGLPEWT